DSEADTHIIGCYHPSEPICKQSKRRCAQTARISLHKSINVKERSRHKTSRTPIPASLPALPPEFFRYGFCRNFRRLRFAVQRRVVFGERLSTVLVPGPQEENDGKMTIFSAAQENLGFARAGSQDFAWPPCRQPR
ncbi:hypothetical protein, partial [Paragemmobacter ruber]|uniref:hypothetical protein n=1 Tax=Paragemmobacter ruber TaxID=1985673 RepID=UPI001F37EE92